MYSSNKLNAVGHCADCSASATIDLVFSFRIEGLQFGSVGPLLHVYSPDP